LAKFVWLIITGLRYRPDLFMGYHIFPGAISALIVGRVLGRPTCYQMTGGPPEVIGGGWRAENRLMARLVRPSILIEHLAIAVIRRFDLVVVRGTKARAFLELHGITGHIAVITGSVAGKPKANHAERYYDIVFVGRLTDIKRPLVFVEIAALARRRHPSLRAAVVGSGPLFHAMQRRSRELNIADCLHFLGQRSDVSAILSRSKIFLLTSSSEGLSIAMAEAMAAGAVPVVADVGDLSDLIDNDRNGFLVTPGNVHEYVDRVVLLLRDHSLRVRLSQSATKTALSNATVEVIAERWSTHLTQILAGSPSHGIEPGLSRRSSVASNESRYDGLR